VGLGAGALPAFLRRVVGLDVLCVEIDADVADAARNFLGVDFRLLASSDDALKRVFNERLSSSMDDRLSSRDDNSGFGLVVEDIADFLDRDECAGSFDVVLLDAYDGQGRVPAHLRDPGNRFVEKLLGSVKNGGCVVANLWNSEDRAEFSRERRELEEFRRQLAAAGASARADVTVRGQENNVVVLADTGGGRLASGSLRRSLVEIVKAHPGVGASLVPPEHFAATEPY